MENSAITLKIKNLAAIDIVAAGGVRESTFRLPGKAAEQTGMKTLNEIFIMKNSGILDENSAYHRAAV